MTDTDVLATTSAAIEQQLRPVEAHERDMFRRYAQGEVFKSDWDEARVRLEVLRRQLLGKHPQVP